MCELEDQLSQGYILEFAREIGLVVVGTSTLDTSLSEFLAECLYLSPTQENVLLRPLGTRAKADTLQRLAKFALDDATARKPVTSWCERVRAKLDDRNTVIHGVPGIHEGKITLRLYRASNAFHGRMEFWPKERVTDLHTGIHDLRKELETQIKPLFGNWILATRQFHEDHFRGPRTPLGE